MVRKLGSNARIGSLRLKRSRRHFSNSYFVQNRYSGSVLDKTLSLRILLKYSFIILAFVVVLASVFVLGKVSAKDGSFVNGNQSQQLSGQTKLIQKEDIAEVSEIKSSPVDEKNIVAAGSDAVPDSDPEMIADKNLIPSRDRIVIEKPEVPCKNGVAEFDYKYSMINMTISDFDIDVRGENWATITALRLTVTNNEKCLIVNPTQLKIKINAKGKGSIWWDDEAFLPDSFKRVPPGATVSEVVPVHVSYSDIYSDKELKITLFDDYDIAMATLKKTGPIK